MANSNLGKTTGEILYAAEVNQLLQVDTITGVGQLEGLIGISSGQGFKVESFTFYKNQVKSSLEIDGSSYYFRPPAMSTTARDLLASPQQGWQIFNVTDQAAQVYANGQWGTMGGGSVISVVISAHGFTSSGDLGIPVTYTGSYQQAEANTPTYAVVAGVLSNIIDVNQFEMQQIGQLTLSNSRWFDVISGGLQAQTMYYLQVSGSPNVYNTVPPTTTGQINKQVLFGLTNSEALLLNYRGIDVGTPGVNFRTFFTSADLVGGDLTVAHGLGEDFVNPTVYNNSSYIIIPNNVIMNVGSETVTLTLSNFTVTDTWAVYIK